MGTVLICHSATSILCRDRFRTMINVEGDAIGAGIVAHLSRNHLTQADDDDDLETERSDITQNNSAPPKYNGIYNSAYDDNVEERTALWWCYRQNNIFLCVLRLHHYNDFMLYSWQVVLMCRFTSSQSEMLTLAVQDPCVAICSTNLYSEI